MKSIQISDIVKAVSGIVLWGEDTAKIRQVVIDSRQAEEGCLFVPIIGERVDAHRFIPDVLKAGAACVFTSDKTIRGERGTGIYVKDTLKALQDFGAWYRSKFSIPVVGITGSVGKTTTKEMISAVLETKYRTLKTIGNLNSQIGLSLMMFHIEEDTEMAVFEMGISMPGEMERLVDIARPETAVMTNIGVSHIGNLGSRENICREKGKILTHFGKEGTLFICGNGDLQKLSAENVPYDCCEGNCRTIFYGTEMGCEYYADDIHGTKDGQIFDFHSPEGTYPVELSVMGIHNVCNAVVALAIGLKYGVPVETGKEALKAYQPIAMRGVVKEVRGIHIIDDTYNASPDSITSNIHALFAYPGEGRRIAVLADVLELGEQSEELHRGIGEYILKEKEEGRVLSLLVTVGQESAHISNFVKDNSDIQTIHFSEKEKALPYLQEQAVAGDWILVKGSRGMQMDKLVEQMI